MKIQKKNFFGCPVHKQIIGSESSDGGHDKYYYYYDYRYTGQPALAGTSS